MQSTIIKKQDGFTLIEIVLAISILATIGMLTINILTNQIETREKVTAHNSVQHAINMAMDKIYSDIQSSYVSNPNDLASLNLSVRAVPPKFSFKNENLILAVQNFRSLLGNSTQSNLAYVRYYIRPNNKDSKKLELIRVVDTDMVENIENSGVGFQEVLVPDLKSFSLEFWNGNEYQKEWDSSANDTQNKIPKLVKIHLETYFPESSSEKQILDLSPNTKKERRSFALDTIAYVLSSNGAQEVTEPSSGDFKWQ